MWVKIDDGFAMHPKVLAAGPLPALIQIRAICYASQHMTDGFIPAAVVPLLLSGFDQLGINTDCQADEIDWPPIMVHNGLWEVVQDGYQIHDYLEWNISKKEYQTVMKQKSLAGKKGMKSRWNKRNSIITPVITSVIPSVITPAITEPYHATSTSTSISISPSSLKSLSSSDSEFDQFWHAYPRKIGKKEARRAWLHAKDRPPLEDILLAIQFQKDSEQWKKDGGQFIPHPSTWLNQGRWADVTKIEIPVPPRPLVGGKAYIKHETTKPEHIEPMPMDFMERIGKRMPTLKEA